MGICRQREVKAANLCKAFPRRPLAALFMPGKVFRSEMKATTRTAAPEPGRGAAPEIFNTLLALLIETTADTLNSSEMPPEMEIRERRRLAMLKLAAASKLPFSDFHNELCFVASHVENQFSDQLDTLSALYDVCFKPAKFRAKAKK